MVRAKAWVAACLCAAMLAGLVPAQAAELKFDLPDGSVAAVNVAPTGTVYVATQDSLRIFDPDGVPLAVVPLVEPGESTWMDGSMWVAVVGSDEIVEVDGTDHTVGRRHAVEQLGDSIAVGDGRLYVASGQQVVAVDPADGTVTELGIDRKRSPLVRTSPGAPEQIFIGERGISPANVERWDVSVLPATEEADSPHTTVGGNLRDLFVDDEATFVYKASASPYEFQLLDVATLSPQTSYPGAAYPNGVAYAPTANRFAGSLSSRPGYSDWQVALWDIGETEPVATWSVVDPEHRAIALSPDGERVYVASQAHQAPAPTLEILTLTPTAPVVLHAQPEDRGVRAWVAPQADDDITGYTITAAPGGQSCSTSASSCVIGGLTNGQPYEISAIATNASGDSVASEPFGPVIPAAAPELANVSVSSAGVVSWSADAAPESYALAFREYDPSQREGLSPSIIGGTPVAYEPHRHTVKLIAFYRDQALWECDGVLVDDEWVLTAAHCMHDDHGISPGYFTVVYGNAVWPDAIADLASFRRFSDGFWLHPDYSSFTLENDLGMIRLDQPVDRAHADPIALLEHGVLADDQPGVVVGWGATETGGPTSEQLMGLDVTIDLVCGAWPAVLGVNFDAAGTVCTDTAPTGVCSGDSGGPLVVERDGIALLAGIVSFGSSAGCGLHAELPDAYVRVDRHVDWIESFTGPLWTRSSVSGTSASLAGLRPETSYLVAVTARSGTASSTALATFMTDSVVVLPPEPPADGPDPDCDTGGSHPFVDVPVTSFAYDSISCIFNLGVTTGTSPTTYDPSGTVSRAQMAAFLGRFYVAVTGESCAGGHPFVDMAGIAWAEEHVGCIHQLGITNGTSPTTYSPAAPVTREQMAAFIARTYRVITGDECGSVSPFVDVSASSFASADIGCIHSLGVTTGTSPGLYSPADLVTRAQMAAFLERLFRVLI